VSSKKWVLFNCSPDIREQIGSIRALQPTGLRQSPIEAIVLTNADIDHIGGLLSLREGSAFRLFGTRAVLKTIKDNPAFAVLDAEIVRQSAFNTGKAFSPVEGLQVEAFEVPGKVPLYMEGESPNTELESEYTVGLEISDNAGRRLHYIPGCAKITTALRARLDGSDCIFFDGTLWRDDEMIAEGLGTKTGRRMGHLPVSGNEGTLAAFAGIEARRKFLIHINNTNPILVEGSPEARAVEGAGWGIAKDGMEIDL
jgi:pyrroloquinoline quinone biosynthesis protein B